MAGLETLMQFVLFLTALFELLQCENTVISIFSIFGSEVLCSLSTFIIFQALVTTMGDVMSAVFLSTVKLFTFHALFSWLLFSILGVHLHYILALFSGLFAGEAKCLLTVSQFFSSSSFRSTLHMHSGSIATLFPGYISPQTIFLLERAVKSHLYYLW